MLRTAPRLLRFIAIGLLCVLLLLIAWRGGRLAWLAWSTAWKIAWREARASRVKFFFVVLAVFLARLERTDCQLALGEPLSDIARSTDGASFVLTTPVRTVTARQIILTTGGQSYPGSGTTGDGYAWALNFGHRIVPPRPALVPLTLGGDDVLFRDLSGVATEVIARTGKASFKEAALFTHKGLSGPAILQISSYWRHGEPVGIDFLPDREQGWLIEAKRAKPRNNIRSLLREALPDRLAATLAERLEVEGELANVPDRVLAQAEAKLADWCFHPNGTEGFAKAEVTIGGISTAELSSKTMEAKRVPGLYAVGEAVDVTGWLGGYNFQWAWASGWAAGQAL